MGQLVWGLTAKVVSVTVLTISRLKRWSIGYYNDTANAVKRSALDAQAANGGLGEYYSETDTRVPTWPLTGDRDAVAGLCGLGAAAVAGGVDHRVRAVATSSSKSRLRPQPAVVSDDVHHLRRGIKFSAAQYLRSIAANDDRPRTMHVEAQQTDRARSPTPSADSWTATTNA